MSENNTSTATAVKQASLLNKTEEMIYEQAILELEDDKYSIGLWAKAFSDSTGDQKKAKAFYIRYRSAQLFEKQRVEKDSRIKAERNEKLFFCCSQCGMKLAITKGDAANLGHSSEPQYRLCPGCKHRFDFRKTYTDQKWNLLHLATEANIPVITDGRVVSEEEEANYQKAITELNGEERSTGLWAKAFSEATGDDEKARAFYIRYRTEQILEKQRVEKEARIKAERAERVLFVCPQCEMKLSMTKSQVADLGQSPNPQIRICPGCEHRFDFRQICTKHGWSFDELRSAVSVEELSTGNPNRASNTANNRAKRSIPITITGGNMKYVLAVIACIGIFLLYITVSVFLGWRHGGGIIPTLILFTSVGAVWAVITGKAKSQKK
ncbi:MAG: hypothetical protein K9N10_22875 [Deltaproteobacteria bacterium]|nr:hypothetical protein [Deltaproteobacteria bacterium]